MAQKNCPYISDILEACKYFPITGIQLYLQFGFWLGENVDEFYIYERVRSRENATFHPFCFKIDAFGIRDAETEEQNLLLHK